MMDQVSSLDETLASLQVDRDARRFDGTKFEDAVLRHAEDIPSWEIAECWRYREWPDRTSVGAPLPSHDAGIDLVAIKHDGSRVATPSCAKTRPSRHRRKNCASRNQAQTLARERVTRQAPTFGCGSTRVPFFAAVRY